tara:strand:+ start:11 stop:499 length:489 start_codon:yes stop_codon:yes gene_type:complete
MALSTIGTNSIADDAVTAAKATGFGKILQVQSTILNSNISTSSTSLEATSFSDSITPSATTSKILILINGGRSSYSGGEAEGTAELYYQVGSGSFSGITNVIKSNNNQSGGFGKPTMSFNYLHSPSSTSTLTYKVYIKTSANTYYLNSDTSNMNMTLMEIGA